MRAARAIAALSSLAAALGCAAPPEPGAADAGPPLAQLYLPRLASPAAAIPFDASPSHGPGGVLTHFRFGFGDGSAVQDSGVAQVQHAFAQEGVYAISLEVEDAEGHTARAQGQLTIRQGAPRCAADTDCQPLDRCLSSLCSDEISSNSP